MATVQLDKDTSLNLQEGEEVIYSHKVTRLDGFLKMSGVNFAITNQRIALVPYKTGKEQENINYADLYRAKITHKGDSKASANFSLVMQEKTKFLGFIPMRKTKMFILKGTMGEIISLGAKAAYKDLKSAVNDLSDMTNAVDLGQSILTATDAAKRERQKRELDQLHTKMLLDIVRAAQTKEAKGKKPTPVDRAELLIALVNEAIKAERGQK